MTSREYWKKREEEALKHYITDEAEYKKHIDGIYDYLLDQIEKEINGFYTKYADAEGITMTEAKKRVSKLDIEAYGRKAEKYVKNKDFSSQANAEMRLYNAAMKINRLEMLKANIGLEMVDSFDELQKYFEQILTKRTIDEFERQAGILGESIKDNAKAAHSIVNASFNNATFSDRIWMYQDMLKSELSSLLAEGLIQGRHPNALARHLQKRFGVQKSYAERLMRTELARVQIEAQKKSYENGGFEQYMFIATHSTRTCPVCAALDGKVFDIKSMVLATNAPPMHPNCRCSTAAYMDRAQVEKELGINNIFSSITSDEELYNKNAVFNIKIDGIGNETTELINNLCKECIDRGHLDGYEHGYVVNLKTNEYRHFCDEAEGEVFGRDFFEYLEEQEKNSVITIHNHANNKGFSYYDMNTYLMQESLKANIAACHSGKSYLIANRIKAFEYGSSWEAADTYADIVNKLKEELNTGKISMSEFSTRKEELCCERMAKEYFSIYEVIE